jgi:hypothetical protein
MCTKETSKFLGITFTQTVFFTCKAGKLEIADKELEHESQ